MTISIQGSARGATRKVWSDDRPDAKCLHCPGRVHGLCKPLSDEDFAGFRDIKYGERDYPVGAELYAEGDEVEYQHTLLEGWVMLYKLLEDGRRQIIRIVLPGDLFGFTSNDGDAIDHTAQALTPVRVCVRLRSRTWDVLKQRPELAVRLAHMLGRELHEANELITSVGCRTAKERVAYFLLNIFYRVRMRDTEPRGASIKLPMTQDIIGDALGLTSVHVNRMLRELRDEHLIRLEKRQLHVLDPDGLADAAEFYADELDGV